MKPTERHAAWLASWAEQRQTGATIQSFVERWSVAPLFSELERTLATATARDPALVLDAARHFFDRATERDELIEALLATSATDPFFIPPFNPLSSEVHCGLLLYHHADLSIALGVTGLDMLAAKKAHRTGPASISFSGVRTIFRYLKAGEATVSFWEAPPVTAGFSAAEAGQCRCVGRRRIADGDEIEIDGSRQSFIVEHATGDMVYLQAVVRAGAAPLTAEYDSDTGRFLAAASTDEAGSRVEMMATLLRQMDRADAVPLLMELLSSPHFFTRWHIMRELLALDAEAAYPALVVMAAEDPHPEVRAAARQTLDRFFGDADTPDGAQQAPQGATACPA